MNKIMAQVYKKETFLRNENDEKSDDFGLRSPVINTENKNSLKIKKSCYLYQVRSQGKDRCTHTVLLVSMRATIYCNLVPSYEESR